MADERSSKRPKIDTDGVDANEALTFELQSGTQSFAFKPAMCHQLFGDDEVIIGHEQPEAKINIDHRTFRYGIHFTSNHGRRDATKV